MLVGYPLNLMMMSSFPVQLHTVMHAGTVLVLPVLSREYTW